MGFNLPILKLDMTNIGLIPRHRANVINSFANSKVNCDLIQKDENGEYTLLNPEWRLKKKFTKEYYDGEHKILTVDLDSENLQINIFTKIVSKFFSYTKA